VLHLLLNGIFTLSFDQPKAYKDKLNMQGKFVCAIATATAAGGAWHWHSLVICDICVGLP
jgi:hypothetical protein